METFLEKKEKNPNAKFIDRQNTKWSKEIISKCDHKWQPVSMVLNKIGSPDNYNNAKTFCICMECCSHTYIETGWVGYFLGSPDELENEGA